MLKPINEALQQTSKQIQEIEKDRKEAYGSLNTTIAQMNLSQQQLQQETQNLYRFRCTKVFYQYFLSKLSYLDNLISSFQFSLLLTISLKNFSHLYYHPPR